jgi:hypothetical protein
VVKDLQPPARNRLGLSSVSSVSSCSKALSSCPCGLLLSPIGQQTVYTHQGNDRARLH